MNSATNNYGLNHSVMTRIKLMALVLINLPVLSASLLANQGVVHSMVQSGGPTGFASVLALLGLTVLAGATSLCRTTDEQRRPRLLSWLCTHQGVIWWAIGVTYSGFFFVMTRNRFDQVSAVIFGVCAVVTLGIAFLEVISRQKGT